MTSKRALSPPRPGRRLFEGHTNKATYKDFKFLFGEPPFVVEKVEDVSGYIKLWSGMKNFLTSPFAPFDRD